MGKQAGGHTLPTLVGIGLTELPISNWAKAHSPHSLTASLHYTYCLNFLKFVKKRYCMKKDLFVYMEKKVLVAKWVVVSFIRLVRKKRTR